MTNSACSDFADEFPNCEVIGTDLSPIQPSWCPPNVKFEIDDAQQPWTFARNSFDFVHLRYIVGGIADWPAFFKEAYAALKPGGWVESFEPEADFRSDDGTIKPDSALYIWRDLFSEGGKKLGVSFTLNTDNTIPKAMEEAGFVNITVKDIKVGSRFYLPHEGPSFLLYHRFRYQAGQLIRSLKRLDNGFNTPWSKTWKVSKHLPLSL